MNTKAIVKMLVRSGYYIIHDPYTFTLGVLFDVKTLMPLKCELVSDRFTEGDWVIVCKEILENRHNCFWHGQNCKAPITIEDPTAWIVTWQNKRSTP